MPDEPPVHIEMSEEDWTNVLSRLSSDAFRLWMDLYPEAFRTGKYAARLPPDLSSRAFVELLQAGEVTVTDDGRRYRHAGVDRARALATQRARDAGHRSAEARRAKAGTAQPKRSDVERPEPGSGGSSGGGQRRTRRTGLTASNITNTETDTSLSSSETYPSPPMEGEGRTALPDGRAAVLPKPPGYDDPENVRRRAAERRRDERRHPPLTLPGGERYEH
jgi:hypothetical protein